MGKFGFVNDCRDTNTLAQEPSTRKSNKEDKDHGYDV